MKLIYWVKKNLWLISIVLVSLTVSGLWFHDGLAKATGESGLLFVTLGRQIGFTLHAWLDTTIGDTSFSSNGAVPLYAFLYLLSMFLKAGYVEGIFFALAMILGGVGICLLTKELVRKISQPFLFFIGIAYLFNPYSIMFIWNRFLYNSILIYGLLPLLIFLWIRYLRKPRLKYLIILFLASFLGSFAFTGVAYILVFFFAVGFWTLLLPTDTDQSRRSYILRAFILGAVFLLSQSFWILPFVAGNRLSVNPDVSFFSASGNLSTTKSLSDYYGGIFNKITMFRADMKTLAKDGIPLAIWYSDRLPSLVSWIPVIMTVISLVALLISKIKIKWSLAFLLIIFLLAVNGTQPPTGNIYLIVYKIHPALQALRNPYEKLGQVFYINFFILWGVGLWVIWSKFSKILGGILVSLSFVWLVVSSWPVINGVVFTYKYRVDNDPKIGFRVKVPEYYGEAKNLLESSKYTFRGIALPMSGEGITHRWEYGYDGVESYNGLFDFPFISLNTTVFHLPEIASSIKFASTPDLLKLAPRLNADYIVNRNDIYVPADSRDPKEVKGDLSAYLNSQSVGELNIFEIPDDLKAPRIFVSNDVFFSNKSDFNNLLDLGNDIKSVLAEVSADKSQGWPENRIFAPNFIVDDLEFVPPTHPDNAIKTLTHSNYPPNHPLYFFVRLKEKILTMFNLFDSETIAITLSGKRLSEIVAVSDSSDRKILSKAIENYFMYIDPVISQARSDIASGNIYEPGGIRWWEIFWYHTTAFEKLLSSTRSENKDLILAAQDRLNSFLTVAGVDHIYASKMGQLSENCTIKRALVSVPSDGKYEFRIKIGINAMNPINTVQIDQDLTNVNFVYDTKEDMFKAELSLKRGIHELRIAVPFQKLEAQKSEITLDTDSSSGNQDNREWNFKVPYGSGEATFNFGYRIIQGFGPRVILQNNENIDSPLLTRREENPNNYYFDWATSTSTIKFDRNIVNLTARILAEPYNNCDSLRYKSCDNEDFKKKFDKRSQFLVRSVQLILVPSIQISFESMVEGNGFNKASLPETSWQKINPSLYKIKVANNSSSGNVLVFSDQYHSGWKLFPVGSGGLGGDILKNWSNFNVNQLSARENFVNTLFLTLGTYSVKPLDENNHLLVNSFANGWKLPQGNSDWILLFTPERELYIGWIITALTIVGLALLILKSIRRNK